MAPQETPIKYGGMAPSRDPFWLLYLHNEIGRLAPSQMRSVKGT